MTKGTHAQILIALCINPPVIRLKDRRTEDNNLGAATGLINECSLYGLIIVKYTYNIPSLGGKMKTTLDIPEDLIKEAMTASKSRTKTEAVINGLRELIRQRKIEKVLASAGKLEFSNDWEKARHER